MSFEPFVVQCQTCGSQLRVADPAIVGTIAPCPKCNSLVQIERTEHQAAGEHQVAVGGSSVDSQAITEEAISSQEGASLGTAPSTTSGFAEKDGQEAGDSDALGGAPTPPAWQSERTQRSRQIGLVVAVSLSSLLAAIAGFSWFVQSWRKNASTTQVAEPPTSTTADPESLVAPEGDDVETESEGTKPDPIPASDTESSVTGTSDSDSTMEEVLNPAVADSSDKPAEPLVDSAETVEQEDAASMDELTPPPGQPATRSGIDDLIPRSPLDPPPPQVPGVEPEKAPKSSTGMQELPPALAAYTKFLIEDGSTEQPTLDAPPTLDEVSIDAATDIMDDPTIIVRPNVVNLKADLAIRMALDTKGYPLPKLASIISQVSGVPIQIDWVSFDMADTDLDAPVATLQGWQSAREILDAAAFKLGAEVREDATLVLITLTDETFDQTLGSLTNLSDFGDGEASAKQVLTDFLRGEGEDAGKEPNLGVSREDRILAVIAADVLRRMRGLAPKVDDSHMHRWAWSSNDPTGEWAPLTGGQPGPQYDTPITMSGFLRRMATRNGVTNLVNWYDFGSRNVAPERLSIPHAEEDAAQTLDRALRPLGLQVRQVDAKHWWVGRESTYDRLPAVIWTPPLGENRDRFVNELAKIMSGTSREAFRMTIDPESDRAILLLPRYIVRQLDKFAGGAAAATDQ